MSRYTVSRPRARGFTLIELVMVLLILGILGALGAPRFMSLRADALAAKMLGDMGALQSAVMLAKTKWETAGRPASIVVAGKTVSFIHGWPTAQGVTQLIDRNAAYLHIATVNSGGYLGQIGGAAFSPSEKFGISVTYSGVVETKPCQFAYNEAHVDGQEPLWDAAKVSAANCTGI